jgi:hypothetical protein
LQLIVSFRARTLEARVLGGTLRRDAGRNRLASACGTS